MYLLRLFIFLIVMSFCSNTSASEDSVKLSLFYKTPLKKRSYFFNTLSNKYNKIDQILIEEEVGFKFVGLSNYLVKYSRRYFKDAVNTHLTHSELNIYSGAQILKQQDSLNDLLSLKEANLKSYIWTKRLPWYLKREFTYVTVGRLDPYISNRILEVKSNLRIKLDFKGSNSIEAVTGDQRSIIQKLIPEQSLLFKQYSKFRIRTRINVKLGGDNFLSTIGAKVRGTLYLRKNIPLGISLSVKHKLEGDSTVTLAFSL